MPRKGKDPTPQGRAPRTGPTGRTPADPTPHVADTDVEKYFHSEPGPDVRRDGVYFYGRKKQLDDGDGPGR